MLIEENTTVLTSKHTRGLTIAKAQDSSQLSKIRKEKGEGYIEMVIAKILKEALSFLKHDLSPDDIMNYATMIHENYWSLRVDDIILCFKNGINGKYKTEYGNITYMQISKWLNEYVEEKYMFIEDRSSVNQEYGQAQAHQIQQNISLTSDQLKQIGKL